MMMMMMLMLMTLMIDQLLHKYSQLAELQHRQHHLLQTYLIYQQTTAALTPMTIMTMSCHILHMITVAHAEY